MATALLSVPTSHPTPISQRTYTTNTDNTTTSWLHNSPSTSIKYPFKPFNIPLFSSSTSVVEDGPSPPPLDAAEAAPVQSESATQEADQLPFRGCKACGREELVWGCNGEGRIQGGIATVPGFGWWPIKAYRPCPGFVASGGRYRRRGQSMDEVVSGGKGRATRVSTSDDVKSSKQQGGMKFKR
ncbi:hypothetical protein Ddye_002916 [Dipteronia dyeriana]|uniref:Uncharacterized protein n=1 Tax=Dipteronia dyeriana TaxID=168575 RepID=A0AAD9XRS5_9ROSI|nr:hypothetical protein Ddye_002916 [Dipteronia dyeriana]